MKVRKLKNLAKFIASIPRKNFNMSLWAHSKEMGKNPEDAKVCLTNATDCGTACCLAGWQVIRQGLCIDDNSIALTKRGNEVGYVPEVAQKQLELDGRERDLLFLPGNWPDRFKLTPKGAAKRILHLIEKGE